MLRNTVGIAHRLYIDGIPDHSCGTIRRAAYCGRVPRRATGMKRLGRYAIVYVLSGEMLFTDARGRSEALEPGCLLIRFPDIPHAHNAPAGRRNSHLYIQFDGPLFDVWRAEGMLDPAEPVWRLAPVDYWQQRMLEFIEPLALRGGRQGLRVLCQFQALLADMRAHHQGRDVDERQERWLEQVCQAVQDVPIDQGVNWEAIARGVGVSYETFRKRFAERVGLSPGKYRARWVMTQACQILTTEPVSVAELARRCGFSDPFHFSKRFKAIVGMPPSHYRRRAEHGEM